MARARPPRVTFYENVRRSRCESSNTNCCTRDVNTLLEICGDHDDRDHARHRRCFDSSVSTIYNLPVGPLVKASKEGWGCYFRHRYGPRYSAQTATNKGSQQGFCTSCKQRRQMKRQLACSSLTATDENRRVPTYRRVSCFREQVERDDVEVSMDGEQARHATSITVIQRLTTRLQILWHEMKIPQPDRAYITSTHLLGWSEQANQRFPKTSRSYTQVRRELERQISLLLRYRSATIKVLRKVELRETRLHDVQQALRSFQWYQGRNNDAMSLITALVGLRDTSLAVIRAVVKWRGNLWQPRPFCWRGVNYLEKMSGDTAFLLSPLGENLLSSVGLTTDDLALVVFSRKYSHRSSHGPSPPMSNELGADSTDPSRCVEYVHLKPKAELVAEYRARFFLGAPRETAGGVQDLGSARAEEGNEELWVVTQEHVLQSSVEEERARLASQGCFVPLLRWLPVESNGPSAPARVRATALDSSNENDEATPPGREDHCCRGEDVDGRATPGNSAEARMPNLPKFPTVPKEREVAERHEDDKIEQLAGRRRMTIAEGYAQEVVTQPDVRSESFMRPAIMTYCPRWGDGPDKWTTDEGSSITEQKRLPPCRRIEPGTEESYPLKVKDDEDPPYHAGRHVNNGSTPQMGTVPAKESTESRLDTSLDRVQHAHTTHEKSPGAVGEAEAECSAADTCVRGDMIYSSRPHDAKPDVPDELNVRTARDTRDAEASSSKISDSQGDDDAEDLEAYSSDAGEDDASEVSRTDGIASLSTLLDHEEESEELSEPHSDQSMGNLLFDTDIEDEEDEDEDEDNEDTSTKREQGAMTSPSTPSASQAARDFGANVGDLSFTTNVLYIQRAWRLKATQRRMAKARQHWERGKAFPQMRRTVEPSRAHEVQQRMAESEKGDSARKIQALAPQQMVKRLAPGRAVEHDAAGGSRSVGWGAFAAFGVYSNPHHRQMRDIDAVLKIQNIVRLKLLSNHRGHGYSLPRNERASGSVSTGGVKIQSSPTTAAGRQGAEKMPKRGKDGKKRNADSHQERVHHDDGEDRAKRSEQFGSQLHLGSAGNFSSTPVSMRCSLSSSSVPTGDIFSVNFDSDSSGGVSDPQVESGSDTDEELRHRN